MTYLNRLESEADRADIIAKYISSEYTTRMVAARVEEIQQARGGTPTRLPTEPAEPAAVSGVQSEREAQGTPDALDASPATITTLEGAMTSAQVTSTTRSPLSVGISAPDSPRSPRDQREAQPQNPATQNSTRLALIVKLKESLDILQSYRRARGNAALTETEQEYLQTMAAIVQDLLP